MLYWLRSSAAIVSSTSSSFLPNVASEISHALPPLASPNWFSTFISTVVRFGRARTGGSHVESRRSPDPDAVDQHFGFADVLQSLVEARHARGVFAVGDEQDRLLLIAALFHFLQRLIQRVVQRRATADVHPGQQRVPECCAIGGEVGDEPTPAWRRSSERFHRPHESSTGNGRLRAELCGSCSACCRSRRE